MERFNSYLNIILYSNKKDWVTNIYQTIINSKNHHHKFFLIIIILTIIFMSVLDKSLSHFIWQRNQKNNNGSINVFVQPEVLLIYVYSKTHSQAFGNLVYFIKHAVRENDSADYYFILQNVDNKTVDESKLPVLPKRNARYIQHENLCFDLGTLGWFLKTHTVGNPWVNQTTTVDQENKINITQYKYFIFINSSVRGPFFPPYYLKLMSDYEEEFEELFPWYHVFTKRINERVKLTGCTISCIPVPHIQSYVLVTDFIGLTILLKPSSQEGSELVGIFACFTVKIHASFHIEVPSSTRILQAGYMIDCVLTKYQQIDFTKPHNQGCNNFGNPHLDKNLDGSTLEPYEVVFVKYNDSPGVQFAKERCRLYERWMEDTMKKK